MDSQNIICAKEKIKCQGKTKDKKQRDEKVCQLYKQNMLVGEIAKILEIDRHTVTRILKKYKTLLYIQITLLPDNSPFFTGAFIMTCITIVTF